MAFGNQTFTDAGGAVSDILGAQATAAGQRITADGMNISAKGMRLNAQGFLVKAAGDEAEAHGYEMASDLSLANEGYVEQSTKLQQLATDRTVFQTIGKQQAGVAGSGFQQSGSALDLLRDSASQGAMTKAVAAQQGLITEAGYKEQSDSYLNMKAAALADEGAQRNMSVDQTNIAAEQDQVANKERDLADQTELNGEITGGIKAAAGIATLFL